jgi:hypothetical protein
MRIAKFAAAFLLSTASLLSAQTVTTIVNFNATNGANPVYMTFVQGRDDASTALPTTVAPTAWVPSSKST